MSAGQKWWGTKRYAPQALREVMRAWAKATRAYAHDSQRWSVKHDKSECFGRVLGVWYALRSVGALSDEQFERMHRRIDRITNAKVTRRAAMQRSA